ncbi:hypothetical protein GCM10010279_29810 [Streptomyces mutabilis]|nr:hypothetical protein GCM10010279_29810 [Streptomyces mutabilis]
MPDGSTGRPYGRSTAFPIRWARQPHSEDARLDGTGGGTEDCSTRALLLPGLIRHPEQLCRKAPLSCRPATGSPDRIGDLETTPARTDGATASHHLGNCRSFGRNNHKSGQKHVDRSWADGHR